jgi:cytochrome c-type biogenesis protein CcmF
MADGNGLIYLSILLVALGVFTSVARLRGWDERMMDASRMITAVLFVTITGMMLFMYYLFLTTDVSYQYVWTYTQEGADLKWRISGTIAGLAGSLLFWLWMTIIPWFIIELRFMKKPINADVLDYTRIGTFVSLGALLYTLGLYEPFAPTVPAALASAPTGQGLNALLQTDLMVIHPPVVFVAYGFMIIPFAAGFAYLMTQHKDWVKLSLFWSRAGWIFLSAGIAIGGVWAYTVLGWGGYWGWDPVETSSLLPWMLLTGFLHAQLMHKRKGEYLILAPLLGIMSFVLVVFATFATRASGLWVSVHSFGSADTNISPWDRLTELLDTTPSISVYLWFMVLSTILAVALAWRVYSSKEKKEEKYFTLGELVDDEMLMFISIAIFIISIFVTFLILLGGVNGLGADNFNTPVGILSLIGTLVLLLCMVWRDWGRKRVVQVAGASLVAGLVGAIVFENSLAALSVPILMVGLVGACYKVYKSFDRNRAMSSLALVGAHLVHLSVVLILIGYVGSTLLQEETVRGMEVDGPSQDFAGYTFSVTNVDSESESVFADVTVAKGDSHVAEARPGVILINGQVRAEVDVVRTLTEDVYLVYHNASSVGGVTTINMTFKVLPLMNVLWFGMILMWLGLIIRMVAEPLARRRRQGRAAPASSRRRHRPAEPAKEVPEDEEDEEPEDEDDDYEDEGDEEEEEEPAGKRDDSYYEDLLEQELKRI